nr:MAG TPA_asm: hypothetical protein [Caudoviricetes sp.]
MRIVFPKPAYLLIFSHKKHCFYLRNMIRYF